MVLQKYYEPTQAPESVGHETAEYQHARSLYRLFEAEGSGLADDRIEFITVNLPKLVSLNLCTRSNK